MSIRAFLQQPALPKYRVPVFRALAARPGIELELAYDKTDDLANVEPDGFRARFVPSKTLALAGRKLHWHPAMLEGASKDRADVLILSWNLNYLSLMPALVKAKKNGVRTILWGHGYTKVDAWYRRWPRERVTALADALLFYNHTHANEFITHGTDPAKVFVAQNALDEAPIAAARDAWLAKPDELERFRRENDLVDRPTVLFVSRLTEKARLDVLIDAVPHLLKRLPRAQVVLIGGGEAGAWEDRAAKLGVADAVRFIGPVYDEPTLAPWFLSAGAFCYPSGVGLSILHTFNYGLPIVTDDNYALHNPEIETLTPGENGLLYRYEDPVDLAERLAMLLGDPVLRERLSKNALATIRERFNLQTMVDGFEAAIRYVAAR